MIISGGRLLLSEQDRSIRSERCRSTSSSARWPRTAGARAVAVVLSGGGSDGSRGIRDVHEAGGPGRRAGRRERAVRRDAADGGATAGRGRLGAAAVRHAAGPPGARGRPRGQRRSGSPSSGHRPAVRPWSRSIGCSRRSTGSTSPTTSRAPSPGASSGAWPWPARRHRGIRPAPEMRIAVSSTCSIAIFSIGVTRFFRDEQAFAVLGEPGPPRSAGAPAARARRLRCGSPAARRAKRLYSLAILLEELTARGATARSRSSPPTCTGARSSTPRAASTTPEARGQRLAGAPGALLHPDRRALPGRPRAAPDGSSSRSTTSSRTRPSPASISSPAATCSSICSRRRSRRCSRSFTSRSTADGVLFLGPSETAGPLAADFETVDKHWRVYRKYSSDARIPVDARLQPRPTARDRPAPAVDPRPAPLALPAPRHLRRAPRASTMPPSLLVNERGELVHAFGGASAFLHAPRRTPGRSTSSSWCDPS